jgi:hypothetical protein
VSNKSSAQRLVVVPEAGDSNSLQPQGSAIVDLVVCSLCFGTGMQVMVGKGARLQLTFLSMYNAHSA